MKAAILVAATVVALFLIPRLIPSVNMIVGFLTQTDQVIINPNGPTFLPTPHPRNLSNGEWKKLDHELTWLETSRLLKDRQFSVIEQSIDDAHAARTQMTGGYWKVYSIYKGLTRPVELGGFVSTGWDQHLEQLNDWKKESPGSRHAKLALAEALVVRGFTEPKSSASTRGICRRAESELNTVEKDAKDLPQFYFTALHLGQLCAWPLKKQIAYFDAGVAIEPAYYHLHAAMGAYLRPEAYGKPGDIAKFIMQRGPLSNDDETEILYFQFASSMHFAYGHELWERTGLSYERAKAGYTILDKIHGTDRYRKNMMMFMAYVAGDLATAADLIPKISGAWDSEVWSSMEEFMMVRSAILESKARQQPNASPQKAPAVRL